MQRRLLALIVLTLVAVFAVAACDSGDSSTATAGAYTVDPEEAVALIASGDYTVIDVRSPEEFAGGHVAGAVNIDVNGPDFEDQVAELDPEEPYLVYCRSGNRSAQAASQMEAAGIEEIADAGGLADLAAAGASIE